MKDAAERAEPAGMARRAECAAVIARGTAKTQKANRLLDEKVKHIHEIRHSINVSMWALGASLSDIHLTQAWRARAKYTSFAGFCAEEINMSIGSVNRLIFISQRFTEDQTKAFGVSRLAEIRRAPEGCWPELLRLCETGATVKHIRAQIRAINKMATRKTGAAGSVYRRAGANANTLRATVAAMKKRNAEQAAKPAHRQEAGVRPLSAQEWSISFMARKSPGEKTAKMARRIAQQPSGSFAIEGVGTITIALFEGEDGAICADAKFEPERRTS